MANLYFRDRKQDLRVIEAGDDVDLNQQDALKQLIQKETGIQVFSPVLQIVNNEKRNSSSPAA